MAPLPGSRSAFALGAHNKYTQTQCHQASVARSSSASYLDSKSLPPPSYTYLHTTSNGIVQLCAGLMHLCWHAHAPNAPRAAHYRGARARNPGLVYGFVGRHAQTMMLPCLPFPACPLTPPHPHTTHTRTGTNEGTLYASCSSTPTRRLPACLRPPTSTTPVFRYPLHQSKPGRPSSFPFRQAPPYTWSLAQA